jgi:hypothetical protein
VGHQLATSWRGHEPDNAATFNLLADWAPEAATRNRILVKNPRSVWIAAKRLNAPSGKRRIKGIGLPFEDLWGRWPGL